MNLYKSNRIKYGLICIITIFCSSVLQAQQTGWKQQDVDWLAGPGGRIKSIRYPQNKESSLATRAGETGGAPKLLTESSGNFKLLFDESLAISASASSNTIDNPPVAGFVPRIVVAVTNKRSDEFDWVAQTHTSIAGSFLTANPQTNFEIGLFDTGASTHIISYEGANRTGIYSSNLITQNTVELSGATNSISGMISQPLGVFVDGLRAIDPNTMQIKYSDMVGQSNVAVVVGNRPEPGQPGLPTVIGSPLSVNFVTAIFNDHQITITRDNNDYDSPDIRFYDHSDINIPDFQQSIPLNLIPTGAVDIEYLPSFASIEDLIFEPGTPSIIVGNSYQSLFFVSSVDLYDGIKSSIDKTRFMLDTGAQITVVGKNVGARLGLNPANPDFEVEIQDVTGTNTFIPGFIIDSLQIAALGEWLSFTNVPVIILNVSSPEGGYLDGIIGTNLFTEFNLVLHGGGLQGQDAPFLAFERIQRIRADIAPQGGDGIVNFVDFAAFAEAWQSTPASSNWNPAADLFPPSVPDDIVDIFDLAEFVNYWLATTEP